ncbi:hypothetical protein VTO73DRAFT_6942 [Trametes versicolor]
MIMNLEPRTGPPCLYRQECYGAWRRTVFSQQTVYLGRITDICRDIAGARGRRFMPTLEWDTEPTRTMALSRSRGVRVERVDGQRRACAFFASVYPLLWLVINPRAPVVPLPTHLRSTWDFLAIRACTAPSTYLILNMDELLAPPRPPREEGAYIPGMRSIRTWQSEVTLSGLAQKTDMELGCFSYSFRSRSPTPFKDAFAEAYREITALSPHPSRSCLSPVPSGSVSGVVEVDEDEEHWAQDTDVLMPAEVSPQAYTCPRRSTVHCRVSDYDRSRQPPTPASPSELLHIHGVQKTPPPSSMEPEALMRSFESNKENTSAVLAPPSVSGCELSGSHLNKPPKRPHRIIAKPKPDRPDIATGRKRGSRTVVQPVAGPSSRAAANGAPSPNDRRTRPPKPTKQHKHSSCREDQPQDETSSITFEDPPARSQSTVIDTSEGKANKRLRSTNAQVKSTQQAAHQVGGCGLGGCAHPLTEEPRENKQHIKDKHDSHIPRKPNQVRPLVGILHRRREPALSRKDVLKCAAEGALMCTWGARGTPCGMIFEGDVAQASLARHVETKHWKRKFGCDTCEFTTCFLYSMKRHKDKWHNCRTDGASGNNPENKEDLDEEEPPKKRRRTK